MKRGIVIGGGVVGLSVAQRLLRAGASVTIMDEARGPGLAHPGAASWGNAGHIAIEQVEPLASWPVLRSAPRRLFSAGGALGLPLSHINQWLPFACRMAAASQPARVEHGRTALRSLLAAALPAWRSLITEVGAPELVRETGHFVVWETRGTAAAGLASWRAVDTGTARFHECDADELRQLASIMKHSPAGAIRFENTAQIADLPRLGEALRSSIVARNGRILQAKVQAVTQENGSVRVTCGDGASLDADFAVITAGVRSRELMEPFCRPVPLIAERGYHIQMTDHGWPDLPPVVFEDRSMIVTRFESGLRAASFVEFSSPDAPPDTRKWQRLRQHIEALGLPCTAAGREWMGARPTLPDYLPAIGRLPNAPNILYAFGHQHLGLTLAAITGELVAQLATQSPTSLSLNAFDIQRFARRQ
jgi:D-hydroxyproline dehydrogenase